MLNENMHRVAKTIEEVITQIFPADYLTVVFDNNRIRIEDIIGQILVECCKYAYDSTEETHSLLFFLKQQYDLQKTSEDSIRMTHKRTVDYIQKKRSILYEEMSNKGIIIDGLLQPDMDNISSRLKGYKFNSFQFWEIGNVHDMRLVKAIVDRRISKKNFNGNMLKEYVAEYDNFVMKLLEDWDKSDEKGLFSFLVMFTLEWKYSINFYYELATEMINSNVSEMPDAERRIGVFSGSLSVNSLFKKLNPIVLGETFLTESRMINLRRKYIHDIVNAPEADFELDMLRFNEGLYIVAVILTRMTYQSSPIREWFVLNSGTEDWISVFRDYDVFQAFVPNKEWEDLKKIRHVKNIYNKISYDYKNPENRS